MFNYRRGAYGSRFTPPNPVTFGISAVLAVLAVLVTYTGTVTPLVSGNAFVTLLIAWVVLVAGGLMRGLSKFAAQPEHWKLSWPGRREGRESLRSPRSPHYTKLLTGYAACLGRALVACAETTRPTSSAIPTDI